MHLFKLPSNVVFEISGPDSGRYLQGRITNDVKALENGQSVQSLVLNPQGKIKGKFVIQKKDESSYLVISDLADSEIIDQFITSLLQFKVADQIEVKPLGDGAELYSLQGNGAEEEAQIVSQFAELIPHNRGAKGYDIVVSKEDASKLKQELSNISRGELQLLEELRIKAGIPLLGAEITDKISVGDIPLDNLVSFHKGCYAGQEVVEMTIARGKPNRMLVKLSGAGAAAGEALSIDGVECGYITSVSGEHSLGFVKSKYAEAKEFICGDSPLKCMWDKC